MAHLLVRIGAREPIEVGLGNRHLGVARRLLAKDEAQEAAGGSCLTCLTGTCGCPGWEVMAEA